MQLYLGRIAYPVRSLGPGSRLALWTAGCSRRCPGCISPELLEARDDQRIEVDLLLSRIEAINLPLEGITLTGGDPLDQPRAVGELLLGIRGIKPTWNVVCYTGHLITNLQKSARHAGALRHIDLLIDGPYRRRVKSDHPLKGSGNQSFHALSPGGARMLRRIEREKRHPTQFAFALSETENGLLVGVGRPEERERAHARLKIIRKPGCVPA